MVKIKSEGNSTHHFRIMYDVLNINEHLKYN